MRGDAWRVTGEVLTGVYAVPAADIEPGATCAVCSYPAPAPRSATVEVVLRDTAQRGAVAAGSYIVVAR